MRTCIRHAIGILVMAALMATVGAEEKRGRFPDNKTIDTFEYTVAPELFGSATRLVITRKGQIAYSYQSQPHTNSGGEVVTRSWELPAREAAALLDGLVADGLLELEDAVGDKFPKHFFAVTYGRWRLSARPKEMPEKVMKRLLPLLRKAHPAQWKEKSAKRVDVAPRLAPQGRPWPGWIRFSSRRPITLW